MKRHNRSILALFPATCLALAGAPADARQAPAPPSPKGLYEGARQRYDRVGSYIARLTRREAVKGERRPEELILVKFRERPWSAHMKWLGEQGRGREGVYVKGRHGDKVHVRLAAWDIPFMPAGRRMALSPDGALLRSASTHPITELGIGAALDKIGRVQAALGRGDRGLGELAVVGPERRDEFAKPAHGIEHRIPPGADPAVPRGGRRTYWLDPASGLPTLIVTLDADGGEVEYYRYDRLQLAVRLDDEDFDPDGLWGAPTPGGR
jgi:hypothetical protein